jgi:hypothetical protein
MAIVGPLSPILAMAITTLRQATLSKLNVQIASLVLPASKEYPPFVHRIPMLVEQQQARPTM